MTEKSRVTGEKAAIILDHAHRTVRVDADPIEISDRTFDLLAALLRNASATVSKAELAQAIWPGEEVSDERLSQRITLLRKALRDGGITSVQVLNDRGRGYSIAGALDASQAGSSEAVDAQSGPARRAPDERRLGLVLAGATLLALAVVAVFLALDNETGPPVLIDRTTGDIRVSFAESEELQNPAIAEIDGRKVLIETLFSIEDIAATPELVPTICRLAKDRTHFASPPDRRLTDQLEQIARSETCDTRNSTKNRTL